MTATPPAPDLPGRERDDPAPVESPGSADSIRPETGEDSSERFAHFLSLLSDDDEVTRWKAAEALGRMGDPAAVDALIETLWDDDARVRLKAAWALGEIGDPRAVTALRRLYRMEREGTQEIIREALDAISRQAGAG
jgi:HEAT repeat protein